MRSRRGGLQPSQHLTASHCGVLSTSTASTSQPPPPGRCQNGAGLTDSLGELCRPSRADAMRLSWAAWRRARRRTLPLSGQGAHDYRVLGTYPLRHMALSASCHSLLSPRTHRLRRHVAFSAILSWGSQVLPNICRHEAGGRGGGRAGTDAICCPFGVPSSRYRRQPTSTDIAAESL